MPRYLGALLEIGLIVFCLIEAIQAAVSYTHLTLPTIYSV